MIRVSEESSSDDDCPFGGHVQDSGVEDLTPSMNEKLVHQFLHCKW